MKFDFRGSTLRLPGCADCAEKKETMDRQCDYCTKSVYRELDNLKTYVGELHSELEAIESGYPACTKAVSDGTCKLAGVMAERDEYKCRAEKAEKSLTAYGYKDLGGELWKPPIGKRPDFEAIDDLRNRIEAAEAKVAILERALQADCDFCLNDTICRKSNKGKIPLCLDWQFNYERFSGGTV